MSLSDICIANETASQSRSLLYDIDPGAKRDPPMQIVDQVLDTVGSELGVFYLLMLGCVFILLNQVDGKLFRTKIFLMNRDFHLVQSDGFVVFLNFILGILSWVSLLMPFLTLAVWAAGLINKATDYDVRPVGGICVLLVGLSFFFLMLGLLKIRWNNYQFTFFNGLWFSISFLFFTAYQFIAIFLDENTSFFGFSAIFLQANCMIMIFIVFLNMSTKGGSVKDLFANRLEKGEPRDPNRENDFMEELNEEKANKQYFPSYEDVIDLFTIPKVGEQSIVETFGGGIQSKFANLSSCAQKTITLFMWSCATAILIVYSYVIFWNFGDSKLGFVILVNVLITDVFLYFFYISKIVQTTTPLAAILFLNRLMLFVFGGDYWIYGWMALYLFYAVVLSLVITQRRFPFENALSNLSLESISGGAKASLDVSKVPEFLIALITAIYAGIFTILYVVEPAGVPLRYLDIDDWEYPYYIIGVFCLLLVAAFFCMLATYRLFVRKYKSIEPKVLYFIKTKKFDLYWIFLIITCILMLVVGLIAYWITDSVSFFLVCFLVTVFGLFYLNAVLHYILNDYDILQNIDALNAKIKKHNERLGDLKGKVDKFKKDLKEGNSSAVGAGSLGLAQSIINSDKMRKKQDKETKKQQMEKKVQELKDNQKSNVFWVSFASKSNNNTTPQQSVKEPRSSKLSQYSSAQVNVKALQGPITRVQPSQLSTPKDEADKLVEEELQKGATLSEHKDEMYEGGDEEDFNKSDVRNQLWGQERDLEQEGDDEDKSSDEELDFEAEDEETKEKSQKKRVKEIKDWRDDMNFVTAFFRGKLRGNDYQIIFSTIVSHLALIILAVLICIDNGSYVGITIAVPLEHYSIAIFSQIKVLSTDAKMTSLQYLFFFTAYAIQYGWGIANLWVTYDDEDLDPSTPGKANAGIFIVVYLIVIPFVTSTATAVFKWIDDKGKFSPFFFIQIALSFLQGVGMLVCAYVYLTYIPGIIISCIIVGVTYCVLQVWIYVKNDYYMPNLWTVINLSIVGAIILSVTIVAIIVDGFSVFFGFSISTWVFAALLFVYGLAEISSDVLKIETTPLFFSPWIFPVYIYNAKKNDVDSHNMPSISLIGGFIIMMIWSVLCSIWVFPHHVGVSLSIFFEVFLIIVVLFLISVSSTQLKEVTRDIDRKIIRRAWLDAKMGYINGRGAMNREQLVTFEKMMQRRDHFRNFMRTKEGREYLSFEEKSEGIKFVAKEDIDLEWVDENQVDLSKQTSCYSYLYEIEQEVKRIYREELELIIQFQLLVVQQAENLQESKKKYLFTFLNEKKAVLFALGIVINIPDQGSMSIRYARVITQILKLSPEKQTMFNHLRDHFIQEQRDIEEKRKEAARIEEEKEKERQEMMAQMSEEKKKLLASVTMDTPVDKMPDCQLKYDKILIEANEGKLFTDVQFRADNSALGEKCLNRGVANWVRARDKAGCVLFKDKINHLDVVQGALGDCYFLSAISVLGDKYVKRIIISGEEQWRKSGAFCVQFYKNGEPEMIIIDDYFPAYANGMWTFVKGGNEGDELWPMVLEKAYAKMYGNYNYIEAGKVQYALSDMTDGFPEQMDLKIEGKNMQVFWEKVKSLKRHGALMGAGTPENALGDRAINEMGIVQGHAYAVLDVQEVDGTRLMQLRNPHGSTGEEWKGDWSDTCLKWTQRMKNKVGYHDVGRDGVFWMDALDFIQQYSYLYICRILDDDEGWKEIRRSGCWKGGSAEGLPTKTNPNARLDFNPQYEILVTKPCDGFVYLLQKDKENMFRGKHSIFFMVSKVNGKRIQKVDKATLVCKSGNPVNLNIITAECDFDKSVSYPYKFTLMIANTERGSQGEGNFEFSVYTTDPNFQVKELPFPKDFPENGNNGGDVE